MECQNEQSNSGAACNGRVLKWDTVIEQKVTELGRFIVGKSSTLEFVEPSPKLERQDDREMRSKILGLNASQAKQQGIGKSTLHYIRKRAERSQSFKPYRGTRQKLEITLAKQVDPQ